MNIEFSNRKSDTGFIYVASCSKLYYELALISCETLREYYPDADVTLFTHKNFLDDRCKIFDTVITDIPIHARAKMWCMARTPYEKTLYNDCDSIIRHKDIKKIHDFLDDCDMFFGSQLYYTVVNYKWAYVDKKRTREAIYHGSLCGYHKTKDNIEFMQTWFDEYVKQVSTPWPYEKNHFQEWQQFDMFTLWRMTSGDFSEFDRFKNLNIKIIPRRFNNTGQDLPEDCNGPPVITQIDKISWSQMPYVWGKIQKEINNDTHKVKQRKASDPFIEYN